MAERFKADALLELKQNDAAAEALDRYLAATREPVPAVLQARGVLHAGKGDLPAAIDLYSAALRLDPKDTKTRGYRAWIYFESGANRLALADFEVCLGEQPTSADYLTGRAAVRVRLGRLPEAQIDAEAAEKQGPLSDRLCYHLSCLYAQAAAQKELEARSGRNRPGELASAHYQEKALAHLERRWRSNRRRTEADSGAIAWRRTRRWRHCGAARCICTWRGSMAGSCSVVITLRVMNWHHAPRDA